MRRRRSIGLVGRTLLLGVMIATPPTSADLRARSAPLSSASQDAPHASAPLRALLDRYCLTCHSDALRTAGLSLERVDIDFEEVHQNTEVLEKVLGKLRSRMMPPAGRPRPSDTEVAESTVWLETALDRAAREHPNPGRPAVHRLNRAEYANAVRDLLALEVDVTALLPPDNSGAGFDNIADLLSVSPSLLEAYLAAARKIGRLALGNTGSQQTIYRVSRDLDQRERVSEDLPLGTRAGIAIRHYFPVDGEYVIKVRMQRNFFEEIRGLADAHRIDVRIDDARVRSFAVGGEPPEIAADDTIAGIHLAISQYLVMADDGLEVRLPIKAGYRVVGVTLANEPTAWEGPLQPKLIPKSSDLFHGRNTGSGIGQVEILGPEHVSGPGAPPSRSRIFVCTPSHASEEAACAEKILSALARRAFRRPVTADEVQDVLSFYAAGRRTGSFDRGIEMALRRILVSPHFLFRIEPDPPGVPPNTPYRLTDLELASRLSFFLWSSIPDDELRSLATQGRLSDPDVLEAQVARMIADDRATALVRNFAGQWLYLRNVPFATPDNDIFGEFDENLREAFWRETELFFESTVREDRSVLDLLTADYTFVNERLARHYGIPDVYGNWFRRVTLTDDTSVRAGLLGKGSTLLVTSYATRTSPVLRGKWILDNLLGTPPPPPPPDVPALQQQKEGKTLSMRAAMEEHRKNPVCASCHARMDPLGFALENFDAIGRWRTADGTADPIDASGVMPDGTPFRGPTEFREALLGRSDDFVRTVIEKLLTYAVGRDLEYHDAPAVRAIARQAADDYRWSSLILGVVQSEPFQMRMSHSGGIQP